MGIQKCSMVLIIGALALVSMAFTAGFTVARRRYRRELIRGTPVELPAPQEKVEFERDRTFYIEMYKQSMQQYDRLIPWGAGGALVLSITLLREVVHALPLPQHVGLLGVQAALRHETAATTRIYTLQKARGEVARALAGVLLSRSSSRRARSTR